MIRDFLTWWRQQLFSLLPERFIQFGAATADGVVLQPVMDGGVEAGVEVFVRKRDQVSTLGRFAIDSAGLTGIRQRAAAAGLPVFVRLPAADILDKRLTFPLAVERDLDRMLRYEMDSETPFSADEVYWDWAIEDRDRVSGKLALRLFLVPRARLVSLLAALKGATIEPRAIETVRLDGSRLVIPLTHDRKHAAGAGRRRLQIAWAACLGLALVAAALPFLRQHWAFTAVDQRIAAAKPLADEASGLRGQLDGTAGGGDVVQAERARRADPLRALAAITTALPDDSYLTDFLLKERKLTITGQSANATRLIGTIAGSDVFRDPSFAAPVTRLGNLAGNLDVFAITAEVRSEP